MLLDLLWIDGLTLKDLSLRRPAFWTAMPAFCNNVRVTGMDIVTAGGNTDGLDPDSTWNVYVSGISLTAATTAWPSRRGATGAGAWSTSARATF